jgi:hypothetical protein
MSIRDLLFYTRGWAKPIYRLQPNDKIQLLHGTGTVVKINHSITGKIKVFWKKDMPHAFQPSFKVYGKKSCVTEFMLLAK